MVDAQGFEVAHLLIAPMPAVIAGLSFFDAVLQCLRKYWIVKLAALRASNQRQKFVNHGHRKRSTRLVDNFVEKPAPKAV